MAACIRADILSGQLAIGARIAGEHELMIRFAASRQTVREALCELAAEGLVESRRGPAGGAFVAAPELDKISGLLQVAGTMMGAFKTFPSREIIMAMFGLESACCRLAAERQDRSDIARMQSAILAAERAPEIAEPFFMAHTAFNRALWRAARNGPLEFILLGFMGNLRRSASTGLPSFERIRAFARVNHAHILDGIRAGDGEAAVAALQENLRFWLNAAEGDANGR